MSNKNVFGRFDSLKQNGFLSTLGPLYVLVQDSKGKVLVFSRWQKKRQFLENWCYQTHCDLIQIKVIVTLNYEIAPAILHFVFLLN